MDLKELKTKSDEELELSLKEFREKLRKMGFDMAEKKLKNVGEISESRKTIARILTLLRSRKAPAVAKALVGKSDGQALLRKNSSDGHAILNKKHGEK
jgi:large subunit ribosomal protein L29